MMSWIHIAEMGFPQGVAGLSLRDRGRSSAIWREVQNRAAAPPHQRELAEEVHLARMPSGCRVCSTGRSPWGRPRTRLRDYLTHLAWERLMMSQEELEIYAGDRDRDVWVFLLNLLPLG